LGSVTPLLAVAEGIHDRRPTAEFLWIGTKDGPERRLIEGAGLKFIAITSGRWRRFITWRNLLTPFFVLRGLIEAFIILCRFWPDIVISAGGFVAVPVIWSAWLLHIPIHIHQMDWQPGLANKLSAPLAKTISVTFEKSKSDFDPRRVTVIGNPVRRFLFAGSAVIARENFGLRKETPTILVLGGGTGATALNQLVIETMLMLGDRVQFLHITGSGKSIEVPQAPNTYHQFSFLNKEIALAYAAADLVVSRAGMGTLTELAALGLPAIIVPIPGSHQEANAEFFVQCGAAKMFDERQPATSLSDLIQSLLADQNQLQRMSAAMLKINDPQAAQRLVDLVL
ncbi:UDP-N-acetylglucosamine--N-acetylmuramyl-(pentapeptide) pyrophosphoryl-undecaprenol N-acetylglucosamine transferase, partial [Patescibacteria group bacterium]|nr:UDP-N-acetylglucosamine--N-acetylmuramyl-(pentapeptide) pyrophosphoryl-undecaprenol N-acetylglucosamine transferase [Patescibacteria group bacterium]